MGEGKREEATERDIGEEFGGRGSEFEFSELEGQVNDDIEKDVKIFQEEMEKWRNKLESKKEEILKIERKKWSTDREYQGE